MTRLLRESLVGLGRLKVRLKTIARLGNWVAASHCTEEAKAILLVAPSLFYHDGGPSRITSAE